MTRAPGHPFPLIPNLRLSLAIVVRDPPGGPMHFAYLKVPETLPRFLTLADGSGFVAVERSEEHTSELQSQSNIVCRLLLEKKQVLDTPSPRWRSHQSRAH